MKPSHVEAKKARAAESMAGDVAALKEQLDRIEAMLQRILTVTGIDQERKLYPGEVLTPERAEGTSLDGVEKALYEELQMPATSESGKLGLVEEPAATPEAAKVEEPAVFETPAVSEAVKVEEPAAPAVALETEAAEVVKPDTVKEKPRGGSKHTAQKA